MRRHIAIATVRLFAVAQVFIAAGVANAQTMKVACVGDSITALPSGWCGYLGTALGSGYMAQTFGVSGTTLLKGTGGLGSYSASAQYKPSHDFAPNIVVIMLGTNDSMPRNWMTGKSHFIADFEELIDSYTSLATKPKVFLNTVPPASDNNQFTISGTTIEKEVNPLIKEVAAKKMCPLVDVWAALDGDVSKLAGSDGVHPGASGSKLIGDAVAKAIMMPMIPTGAAGMGATAGTGASAGSGGMAAMAGAMAMAGANAGGAGMAMAGTGATAGGGAGAPSTSAGTGASTSTAGSRASAAGSTSSAGGAGSPATAGTTSTSINPIGAAGSATMVPPTASSDDGGCRTAGSSTSNSGPTAALILLLGMLIRRRKRNGATESLMHRNLAKAIVQLSVIALTLTAGVVSAQTVKVACVGDSITALPSSWCGNLSTKLGSGYMVQNFGVSGTNLAKDVSQPYWSSAQYTPSHTFAPNIVIIMLGTNDAFSFSWSGAKTHFVADYKELLDTYTSLASKPKPYMIIPTPIGTSPFGHDGNLLATEVVPLVKQVAMEKMVPTIDAFTLFGGAMFDASLYSSSDQVHPNATGQKKISDEVYKVLMETGALGGSGSAGSGATAGTGASAGSGGTSAMAGAMAMAGANAGGAGMATAGTGATAGGAGGGAGTPSASAGTGASTPTAGSRASAAGSTSSAGGAGSPATAGTTSTIMNPIGAAGSATMVPPTASSDDGGCRTAGSSTSNSGPTAALVLLLGILIRRRKRDRV